MLTILNSRHRLEACKQLGWSEVPATVLSLTDLDRELAEIDENLIRNELTVLERSQHLKRRKQIYQAKHPQTKQGGLPGKSGGGKKPKNAESASFAEDTAKKTGAATRTIQHEVQIANKLDSEVKELIRNLPLADNNLMHLLL